MYRQKFVSILLVLDQNKMSLKSGKLEMLLSVHTEPSLINVDDKQSDEQFGDEERETPQEHKASDTENEDDALAMAKTES